MTKDGGLDSVTQYELWKATWSSLNDSNFYELAQALKRYGRAAGHVSCRRRHWATTT